MKLSDIIMISEPEFLPVRIWAINEYKTCPHIEDYECFDCEFYPGDDADDCEKLTVDRAKCDEYVGDCSNAPIRLANRRVKSISVSNRTVKKRKSSHDLVQLEIEIEQG